MRTNSPYTASCRSSPEITRTKRPRGSHVTIRTVHDREDFSFPEEFLAYLTESSSPGENSSLSCSASLVDNSPVEDITDKRPGDRGLSRRESGIIVSMIGRMHHSSFTWTSWWRTWPPQGQGCWNWARSSSTTRTSTRIRQATRSASSRAPAGHRPSPVAGEFPLPSGG